MPSDTEIAVVLIYPDILGTYGDRGNALALVHRARARGLAARVIEVSTREMVPESAEVYLLGGGEDSAQHLGLAQLRQDSNLAKALGEGATCLAVCAGFQLLAREFTGSEGNTEQGLGVLDVACGRLPSQRAVGEIVTEPVGISGLPMLTGYENHLGNAVLGADARPLGRLVRGIGNGDRRTEGAVQDNIVATYLHGPVLVRNPALADHLLERSTGPLAPYDDELAEQLRHERLEEVRHRGNRH
ncbi:MAG: glutamine amidotransferase [Nocardioidaceae bacterium]